MKFLKLENSWVNMARVVSVSETENGAFCLLFTADENSNEWAILTDPADIRTLVAFLHAESWTPPGPNT